MSIQNNKTILVCDVMMALDRVPVIIETAIFKEAIEEMGRTRLGIVCIVRGDNKLLGILTDGDIRRKLLSVQKPLSAFFIDDALDHAIRSPLTTSPEDALAHAVDVMDIKQIWDLPVVDSDSKLVGLLHLHPAVKSLLDSKS